MTPHDFARLVDTHGPPLLLYARQWCATGRPKGKVEALLFGALLSHVHKVGMAQGRVQQRFGLLRCVEALRVYAAEHEGRLPARLEDIKLPLPLDPITGPPFPSPFTPPTATAPAPP